MAVAAAGCDEVSVPSFWRVAALALYLGCAAYALRLSIAAPLHDWDAIGYIAAAESLESSDIQSVHAFTYAQMRAALSADEYEFLAQEKTQTAGRGSAYRRAVSADPAVLAEQMPFYRIRPLYVGGVFALYKTGLNIESATHVVSGIGVATGLMLLYAAAMPILPFAGVLLLLPLAYWFGVFELARHATPDGAAFFAYMLAALLLVRGQLVAICIALPLVIGVRTDLILFTLPLLGLLLLQNPERRRLIAVALGASVVIYAGIVTYAGNAGWSIFFYCTTVQRCLHPLSDPPTLHFQHYFNALSNGLPQLIADTRFLSFVVLAGCAFWIWRTREHFSRSPAATLLSASVICIVARFLVLPAEWERAFPAPYLLTAFSLFALLGEKGPEKESSSANASPATSADTA